MSISARGMHQALTLSRPLDGLRKSAAQWKLRAVAFWRAYPRETAGFGVLGLVGAVALAGSINSGPQAPTQTAAPPAPPPLLIRQLAPEQALHVNQEIPLAHGPNPAANAFVFRGNAAARAQALECLASAVYYEAGSQDDNGERAVAQVVLNRVRHPAFPASVCGVVYQGSTRPTGCQFTFTCDGSMQRQPDAQGWKRASRIAQEALDGYVYAPVGWATHYHADYVLPTWASTMAKNAIVGAHLFYRWSGGWGQPRAFTSAYAGREPNAGALRIAALAVPRVTPVYGQRGQVAQAIKNIPGAEAIKLAPSMRGERGVAVRFNLAARKASDEAAHEDYTKKFATSDNLRWSLSSDTVAENQAPLGKAQAGPASGAAGER